MLDRIGPALYGIAVATGSAMEYLLLLRGGIGAAMRRHVTLAAQSGNAEKARAHYAAGFWWGTIAHLVILVLGAVLAAPLVRFLGVADGLVRDAAVGVALIIAAMVVANTGATFEVPVYATGRLFGIQVIGAVGPWLRVVLLVAAFHLLAPSLALYGLTLIVAEMAVMFGLAVLAQRAATVGPALPAPALGRSDVRRELLGYGAVALLSQIASLLFLSTDNLLIGRFYGPESVTTYSLGARWEPMIRGFLWAPVIALAPLFTQMEARAQEERSRRSVRRAVALASSVAVPACLVPCVVGDLFIEHWVGPQYKEAATYLVAMLAPSTLTIALAPVWAALVGRGRIGWIAAGDLAVAVLGVAASLVLALPAGLGLLGFALGKTIALLCKNLLLVPLAGGRDSSLPSAAQLLAPLPLAILGAAPGLLALYLCRPILSGSLAAVIAGGSGASALCLAGALTVAVGPKEIKNLLRSSGLAGRVGIR